MPRLRRSIPAFLIAAAGLVATACSSDGGTRGATGSGVSDGPSHDGNWAEGEAVQGDYGVTWKNLNPKSKGGAFSLVNESSEIGRKLKAGTATSSEIRVIGDREMGRLLAELKKAGFYQYATQGLGLGDVAQTHATTGAVVVTERGKTFGFVLRPNVGKGPEADSYIALKQLILGVHGQVASFDVKAGMGAADESIFGAPKPGPLRRP